MLLRSPIHLRTDCRSRGFSFVELMFAVMVLGIGFIMIAAVFPVGLQQVKDSLDESAAAANARGAVVGLEQIGQNLSLYTGSAPVTPANSTYPFPETFSGTLPTPVQLAVGSSVELPGKIRSLRDASDFADAGSMSPTDTTARKNAIWAIVAPQLINSADARNGSAILYRRDVIVTNSAGTIKTTPAPSAQIIVINSQASTHSDYQLGSTLASGAVGDVLAPAMPIIANLEPRPVGVVIQYLPSEGVYTATFSSANAAGFGPAANKSQYDAVPYAIAEGTYIVIADDRITDARGAAGTFPNDAGRMNGRIFKVGVARADINPNMSVWQLAPGYVFTADPGTSGVLDDASPTGGDDIVSIGVDPPTKSSGTANAASPVAYDSTNVTTAGPAVAYVLGRGFSDLSTTPAASAVYGPYTTGSTYSGQAQDVAIYTTFINVP